MIDSIESSAATLKQRLTMKANGQVFDEFLSVDIDRDLERVAGSFDVTVYDQARLDKIGSAYDQFAGNNQPLKPGDKVQFFIDGALVLDGFIVVADTKWSANTLSVRITGYDKTGDLVKCAAVPNGPAEFKGVDLLFVTKAICEPFGITVRADGDVGEPFVRLAMGTHDTALAAIEKAARQRSILPVSDGIGGLVLTQGGSSRAPSPLRLGGNVQDSQGTRSWEDRFSDYYVKGQTEKCNGKRAGVPVHLDSTVSPLAGGRAAPAPVIAPEAGAILMTGHAIDPEITRYRPTVRLTRTQSGMSSTQEQAEWAARVARGQSERLVYTVLDWRTDPIGPSGTLWIPNQVSAVLDPVALINEDMLIAGVHWAYHEDGMKTHLRVVGVTAYDRINEAAKKRPRSAPKGKVALDSSVSPLSAP